jgi:hypothetical protein
MHLVLYRSQRISRPREQRAGERQHEGVGAYEFLRSGLPPGGGADEANHSKQNLHEPWNIRSSTHSCGGTPDLADEVDSLAGVTGQPEGLHLPLRRLRAGGLLRHGAQRHSRQSPRTPTPSPARH